MKIIADESKLKSDRLSSQVVEVLCDNIKDDSVYLYYKYPIYRGDLPDDLVQAQLLITSPKFGVCYIYYSSKQFTHENEEYLDNLDSNLLRKFINRPELRKNRRELKFEITGIIISNEVKEVGDYKFIRLNGLIEFLRSCELEEPLTKDEYRLLLSCIDNTTKLTIKKQRNNTNAENTLFTKGDALDYIQQKEACFDLEQRKIALSCIDCPQRIRGLAGSGKTILLAMKAALYHLSNPNAEILYTYYTKDLYDQIHKLIERFYRESSDNQEPNWKKIHIYHAWGGYELEGVYSSACSDLNVPPIKFPEANYHNASSPFAYVCSTLLNEEIIPKYDLTLIDEGQDFPNEFYQLCYRLTKDRRIVWAYDEFQNIFNTSLQDEKDTYGKNQNGEYNVDFSKGLNPNQDMILHCCYRTPRTVLVAAFSLGLGIYNHSILQRLESNLHWESLGFTVESGDCSTGSRMIISRPEENTPSAVNDVFKGDLITIQAFDSISSECEYVCKCISDDIKKEKLLADDICVICLDMRNIGSYYSRISTRLSEFGIRTFNMLTAPNSNKRFFYSSQVTLATLNKAKGNECGMVYIVGTDAVFSNQDNIIYRNRLFTAMTRAKGWVVLCGSNVEAMKKCESEYKKLASENYKLIFEQPSELQTKTVMQGSLEQQKKIKDLKIQIEDLRKSGLSEDAVLNIIKGK